MGFSIPCREAEIVLQKEARMGWYTLLGSANGFGKAK